MTTINSLDDFLRALDDNPSWKEAVRARILGEELLQLPARFDAFAGEMHTFVGEMHTFVGEMHTFVKEQKAVNAELRSDIAELKAFNETQMAFNGEVRADISELKSFTESQRLWNRNATARFYRMEGDIGALKGHYIRTVSVEDAPGIASDMGLQYIRTLSRDDLNRMVAGSLPRDMARSFRNADLVMEVTGEQETSYIAMEISHTADRRESDRVIRNADIITRFTGLPAQPVIASVRNDHEVAELVESGAVHWHPIEDRGPSTE